MNKTALPLAAAALVFSLLLVGSNAEAFPSVDAYHALLHNFSTSAPAVVPSLSTVRADAENQCSGDLSLRRTAQRVSCG